MTDWGNVGGWFNGPNFTRGKMITSHTVTIGDWTHVVAVLDANIGTTWYINGIQDMFFNMTPTDSKTHPDTDCPSVRIGAENKQGRYGFKGSLDDIKYWYRKLTSEGENSSP